jgi:hypothetical protein
MHRKSFIFHDPFNAPYQLLCNNFFAPGESDVIRIPRVTAIQFIRQTLEAVVKGKT